jgi:hypothetical protein
MKRHLVLAAALCLAAALSVGAAPALAADGCDCHTAATPTATPAHASLVATATDCTICHLGWTETLPHPTTVTPTLTATVGPSGGWIPNWTVRGGLAIPWVPLSGVVVYVQMLGPGATGYTDIGECATNWRGLFFKSKAGTGTVRCISQGVAGSPVVLPSLSVAPVDLPSPRITCRLSGPRAGILKFGRRVTATGRVRPLAVAGQTVVIQYTGRRAGKTTEHAQVKRTIRAAGTYRWTFKPKYRGKYIIKAFVLTTSAYALDRARAFRFQVK